MKGVPASTLVRTSALAGAGEQTQRQFEEGEVVVAEAAAVLARN